MIELDVYLSCIFKEVLSDVVKTELVDTCVVEEPAHLDHLTHTHCLRGKQILFVMERHFMGDWKVCSCWCALVCLHSQKYMGGG